MKKNDKILAKMGAAIGILDLLAMIYNTGDEEELLKNTGSWTFNHTIELLQEVETYLETEVKPEA